MERKFRGTILILSVILTVFFCSCGELEVEDGIQINIESSSLYEKEEIQSAIDMCVDYFNENYEGCTMTEISYEEELCRKEKEHWITQYEEEDAIILTSTFFVDENGGDGSFNPNETYTNWMWILTRSDSNGAEWTLRTWGY